MPYNPADGPLCGHCRTSEAHCARNYPCCRDCTHFGAVVTEVTLPEAGDYNEAGEKWFVCYECSNGFWRKPQGPAKRLCEDCTGRAVYADGRARVIGVQNRLKSLDGYSWLVTYTGLAHLYGENARMSHCGASRARGTDPGQYSAEFKRCKRCLGYVPLEEVVAPSHDRRRVTERSVRCDDPKEGAG